MRPRESRSEYARRFHRVTEHIDRHLDAPLDLATLADVAHFSPFHFHRLFAAWMGETLGDYLRRRRIEVAATRLAAQPRLPVLQVALSVGFGSSEAFAHAFRSRFGMSASAWRRQAALRKVDQVDRKSDQASVAAQGDDDGSPSEQAYTMNVQLIDREPMRIAYLRYTGPYGPPLGRFWKQRVMPWIEESGLGNRPMVGISHDNPGVTAPDKCRCDVGVEIDDDHVATGDEQITVIPGGRYAVTRFSGTADTVHRTWEAMMREWLPASGYQLDARPMFEYYGPGMSHDEATGVFQCDVTIPVAPL